ncbi:General stress protein 26 [Parelusimicrobium proximum]|uniref:pyridoxamine 5'-phosphate oxidase family protein n=1 Tax=Parelusimicrobium proximum TaxID=3228953 RepID=UPI003D179053
MQILGRAQIDSTIRDIVSKSKVFYLGTNGTDGYPDTVTMINLCHSGIFASVKPLFHSDDLALFFATRASSGKVGRIERDPQVSAFYELPDLYEALLLKGEAKEEVDMNIKKAFWQPNWNLFYGQNPEDPEYKIYRIVPTSGKFHQRYHTMEFLL